MTSEARLAFLLLFLFGWTVLGLIPWTVTTVASRGRGAAWTLPLAIGAACAGGILVPAMGLRDSGGLVLSGVAALAASAVASVTAFRVWRRFFAPPDGTDWRPGSLPRKGPAAAEGSSAEKASVSPRPPETGPVD